MFAGLVHFFLLNFFIGIMEGYWLRADLNRLGLIRPWYDPFIRLILANYASAFVGLCLVLFLNFRLKFEMLDSGGLWQGHAKFVKELGIMFSILYPISVFIETIFISVFSKRKTPSLRYDIGLSAKFNLASHILLFGFYYWMQASVLNA